MSDAPIAFTTFLGLGQWADGVDPGFEALNQNWTLIDTAVKAVSDGLWTYGAEKPATYPSGKIFFDTTLKALFVNVASEDAPEWTQLSELVSDAAVAFGVPRANAGGKIDTAWLKDDVLLADGSVALTGDLDAGGKKITNLGAPAGPNDAARLTDISGLKRVTADVVADANVSIASGLENGDTVNGHVLATGERVLLPVQTDGKENGVYVVPVSGAASRSTDANTAVKLQNLYVIVADGTKWFGPSDPFTLGVDDVVFIEDPATAYEAGDHIDISAGVISVTGLAVPEAGRMVRTTDQNTGGVATDVVFTTVKSNDNSPIDLDDDPKAYKVKQGGPNTINGAVRMKKSSSGTYVKLELVDADTDEVYDSKTVPPVWNNQNASLNVSVSGSFAANTKFKLRVTTDALGDGRIIEWASLSGMAGGAGVIGDPAGGVDLAEVMAFKSFFDFHGLLPANVLREHLYDFPTPDASYLNGGTLTVKKGGALFTAGANSNAMVAWDAGAAYNRYLIILGQRPRPYATGLFVVGSQINSINQQDGYYFMIDPFNSKSKISKTISTVETIIDQTGQYYPVDSPSNPTFLMAAYVDLAAHVQYMFLRTGGEVWYENLTGADTQFSGPFQYYGIELPGNAPGRIMHLVDPFCVYAD